MALFQKASRRFFCFLFLAVFFIALGAFVSFDQDRIAGLLGRMPFWLSGTAFVVLYVVLSFFIWIGPKDVFKLVGIVLYGPYLSTALIYAAEMLNVITLFSLSRWLGRTFVAARLRGRMRQVDQTIADTSFVSIFFLRFFPVVPFRFLDLAFGLTRISLRKYLTIAALASPLRIFIVQLFLSLGWEVVSDPQRFAEYLLAHPQLLRMSMVYTAGSVVAALWIGRRMRKKAGDIKSGAAMKEIICPNCKKPLYEGEELFCHFCGESLRKSGRGVFGALKYGWFKPVTVMIILVLLFMLLILAALF